MYSFDNHGCVIDLVGVEPAQVQERVENHLKNLLIKHFDPQKADSIFTVEGEVSFSSWLFQLKSLLLFIMPLLKRKINFACYFPAVLRLLRGWSRWSHTQRGGTSSTSWLKPIQTASCLTSLWRWACAITSRVRARVEVIIIDQACFIKWRTPAFSQKVISGYIRATRLIQNQRCLLD